MLSIWKNARLSNLPSVTTVSYTHLYYCGNKTHKYDYKLNDVKYLDQSEWIMYKDEDTVPPIVSEELWNKANKILAERSEKQGAEDKTSYHVYSTIRSRKRRIKISEKLSMHCVSL